VAFDVPSAAAGNVGAMSMSGLRWVRGLVAGLSAASALLAADGSPTRQQVAASLVTGLTTAASVSLFSNDDPASERKKMLPAQAGIVRSEGCVTLFAAAC
jgi:hypothetical protein